MRHGKGTLVHGPSSAGSPPQVSSFATYPLRGSPATSLSSEHRDPKSYGLPLPAQHMKVRLHQGSEIWRLHPVRRDLALHLTTSKVASSTSCKVVVSRVAGSMLSWRLCFSALLPQESQFRRRSNCFSSIPPTNHTRTTSCKSLQLQRRMDSRTRQAAKESRYFDRELSHSAYPPNGDRVPNQ